MRKVRDKLKKTVVSLSLLIILFGSLTCLSQETLTLSPNTITVPYDYATIQEAIDNANPGDTVYVYNNTYYEHLKINKSINLIGQDPDITIINGNATGITLYISASNVNVSGFTLKNAEKGLNLYNCSNCIIEKNILANMILHAVEIELSQNIIIKNSFVKKFSQNGIYLKNSNHSLIQNNNITCDERWSQGIFVYQSNYNIISGNRVIGTALYMNEGGVGLLYSQNNSVINNYILNNYWSGLSIRYSNKTFIWGNTMKDHVWFGLRNTYSYENQIYCNNFINNKHQVSIESANATWCFNGLGNYWSDYAGSDSEPDGIGDTPYNITASITDNFPLMGTFSVYIVFNEEGEENLVSIISNSTISNFKFITYFDAELGQNVSSIKFNVTGNPESISFCRINIPRAILKGPYTITVDGAEPIIAKEIASNSTHAILYFTCYNSKQVTIIPEQTLTLLLSLMLISLCVELAKKRKHAKNMLTL